LTYVKTMVTLQLIYQKFLNLYLMSTEQWKPLEKFPGYKISDLGRVYSEKRSKVLKNRVTTTGYEIVDLPVGNKKYKSFHIHSLVAENFVPNEDPENLTNIIHLNWERADNRANNLKWASRADTSAYAFRTHDSVNEKDTLEHSDITLRPEEHVKEKILGKKNVWYFYQGKYRKVRISKSSLYFFIKDPETFDWSIKTVAHDILENTVGSCPSPKHKAGYLDFNITNLHPRNLVWETQSEKLKRLVKFNPTYVRERSEAIAKVLTQEVPYLKKRRIQNLYKLGNSVEKIAKKVKLSRYMVDKEIKNGGTK